jgi:predicted 3-demethylubiquinone-9 3-methyltransferase (glyoxalase superfamily)
MLSKQKITPCLWFDTQAEEAAQLYTSLFKNSKITAISRYSEVGKELHRKPVGSVMVVAFELEGQAFTALNGGPIFKLNEAVSFQVSCDDQAEVDHFWNGLSAGGTESNCGWLKDRFGLSWQIIPKVFFEIMSGPDKERAQRAMQAMFKMKKFDIATLVKA